MSVIAEDLSRGVDPAQLASALGAVLDDWQEDLVRSEEDALVLAGRQCGKSLAAGVVAAHTAIYRPRSLTLIVNPAERQSRELYRTVLQIYRSLDRPVEAESENSLTLSLANGSRVVVLPGSSSTIRGYSNVDLLLLDEAARIEDEVWSSVSPMLSVSRGRAICLTTPAGMRGWFHAQWVSRPDRWRRYEIPASKCARISAEFLERERLSMSAREFGEEYMCRFRDPRSAAFREADIVAIIDEELQPWPV